MSKKDRDYKSSPIPSEIKGLLVIIAAILLVLSLVSFIDGNPSGNWLGLLGYLISWSLLYSFGLVSYLIALFMCWIGWHLLLNKPIHNFALRASYFAVFICSGCILFNLIAETNRDIGKFFSPWVYSENVIFDTPISYDHVRHNLGGVPFYYLYRDIPQFNLQRLLSNVGISMVFSIFLAISFILFTEIPVISLLKKVPSLFKGLFHREKTEPKIHIERHLFRSFKEFLKKLWPKPKPKPVIQESVPDIFQSLSSEVSLLANKRTSKIPVKRPVPKETAVVPERHTHRWDKFLSSYTLPKPSLLSEPVKISQNTLKKDLREQSEILKETLSSFGIDATVGAIHCGPTIASFEIQPASGVKVQKIKALDNDIALNLKAKSIRIIAPIPGKAAVGIEVPTPHPQEVSFRELLVSYQKGSKKHRIPLLLGKTVNGSMVTHDLVKMPHCIIAGATGSGKSVCINTIIMSILMNMRPEEIKLIMIDPKKVELTPYSNIPHMLSPVITDPDDARYALNWLVREMEQRYEIFKQVGARHIEAFNNRKINVELEEALDIEIPQKMPYIVGIIDELADLMIVASSDIETPIARIAQMARAVGIHLIISTQRPSREVITGLIRANFPTRVAFKVASRINSQIILDDIGAETLLGNGDMLFLPSGSLMIRAQGAFIRDSEINDVINDVCSKAPPQYVIDSFGELSGGKGFDYEEPGDALYDSAYSLVTETGNASTTFLQRKLKIGYARAASLMDMLELRGVVGPQEGSRPRKVLIFENQSDE